MAVCCDGEYGGCRVDGCNVDGCNVDGCRVDGSRSDFQSRYPVCFWPLCGMAFVVELKPFGAG